MSALEAGILSACGRRYAYLTGRGATGIYLALRARGIRGKTVLLPSILCPSPANAVIYSGNRPLFCDMDPRTFGFDERHLGRLLKRRDIGAAILVHLYGYPFALGTAERLKRSGIFLIEDACQALGTAALIKNGAPVADCAVLSFGHSKIIDVGDGGAVVSDDKKLMSALCREGRALGTKSPRHGEMASLYRRLYYALTEAAKLDARFHGPMVYFPDLFKGLYLYSYRASVSGPLGAKLKNLNKCLARRRKLFELYRRLLGPRDIFFPALPDSCPVWRASGLAASGAQRDRVVSGLRAHKIDVSAWYPSLHRWYKDPEGKAHRDGDYPKSRDLENRILNFWVDETVSEQSVKKTCNLVKGFLR